MEKLYPQMVGVPLGHWENRLNHLKETQVLGISTPPDTKTSLATAADGPQRCLSTSTLISSGGLGNPMKFSADLHEVL